MPRSFHSRIFLAILLFFMVLTLVAPLESYPASAQVQPVEVHNPLRFRVLSQTSPGVPPFFPSDIRTAYDYLPLYARGINGTGTRIAIVDAYGSPSIATDISSFDSLTGLPTPAGFVTLYYPNGVPKRGNSGWAVETALDVEWAHAIAPAAKIDLVIAVDASLAHVYDAIAYVASNLTNETVLSMSFGQTENLYPSTGTGTIAQTHQAFVTLASHGTSIFASSGDVIPTSCCSPDYPATDPLVVAVGGTTLTLNSTANYVSEVPWYSPGGTNPGGSTAGSSTVYSKPAYQKGLGDSMRDDVDVSYDGDPATGVFVVQGGIEYQVGGTSMGSPQWAGLIDLASQANRTRFGSIVPQLYNLTSYHDVTTGQDGFFTATKGWDYPTGLGSPDANGIVTSLSSKGANVGLTAILPSRNFAYSGVFADPVMVNVTVANRGSGPASLTLTLKVNSTAVGNMNVTLGGGTNKVESFSLNTASLSRGNYSLSAQVALEAGITNLGNSTMTSSNPFSVRLAGDTNNDCKVNIADLTTVGGAFGSTPGSSNWNPYADLNNDGIINIGDLTIVGGSFGSTC